ncbi:cytochrome c [Paraburkholderia bannensis]|uniref:cytochrome c n=1 Tax=Paraburkholderia bannensis TaxID=765414 RepID=UPI002AB5EA3D|nr:cytochrome c [Paraburkholderia bannensis]
MKTSRIRFVLIAAMLMLGAAQQAWAGVDADTAMIARGEYLARAGDCIACHTASGGKPFAGGLPIKSPMGVMYSTNITPDPVHGIGRYTEPEFAKAVRLGIRRDGKNLYPAMPYPDYRAITDSDVQALYAYFMKGVAPVAKTPPVTALAFPFNQRWGMALWNFAFTSDKPFVLNKAESLEVNRGRYLVQTLGHCSSCHTPRGVGMQELALDDSSSSFLSGGELNGWGVPSLRGMPSWSVADITAYLETGRNGFTSVGGEMTGVVDHSTQHLSAEDLQSIAVYLKSLPEEKKVAQTHSNNDAATQKTVQQLVQGQSLSAGQMVYLNNCEACHATNGKGATGIFPSLNGSEVVQSKNPTALISVILKGAQTPSTQKAPSVLAMPGFEGRLNDEEIAHLATFLRSGWGNNADAVSTGAVSKVRKSLVGASKG